MKNLISEVYTQQWVRAAGTRRWGKRGGRRGQTAANRAHRLSIK